MTLSAGLHHVAMLTADLDAYLDFYTEVFDADVLVDMEEDGLRHAFLDLGRGASLHAFEMPDHADARGRNEIFTRGHLDHIAINVEDRATFEELRRRLVERGATDGTVTDFGRVRSVWFQDPDGFGLEIALWQDEPMLRFNQRGQERYAETGATVG
jgi:catechol 2,3-dioxygenase-like lactoylglutathione lyase family enzyme